MIEEESKTNYNIKIDKTALNFLDSLDDYKYNKLIERIYELEKEPRPIGSTKLNVYLGYRIKWSKYRILYTIDDVNHLVNIYKISHRKDAYKH